MFEVDLQHPVAEEFTAVAVAGLLGTQDPFQHCVNDVEKAAIVLHLKTCQEDNLYVFEVDLRHPAADEFTAVAVAGFFWGRNTLFKSV